MYANKCVSVVSILTSVLYLLHRPMYANKCVSVVSISTSVLYLFHRHAYANRCDSDTLDPEIVDIKEIPPGRVIVADCENRCVKVFHTSVSSSCFIPSFIIM